MRFQNRVVFFLIAALAALSVSASAFADDGSGTLVSEGTDTPITVTGYSDFTQAFRFLEEGDKVAVISPSALPTREQYEATVNGLREWGYVPVPGKYACVEERTLENCMEDLQWALEDPEIRAVFCVRGGYAASEVMDRFPLSRIREAGKPIIGYSDITVYLSSWVSAGVPCIHAPMAVAWMTLSEECAEVEKRILRGEIPSYRCGSSGYDLEGAAEGILIGGNLATLTCAVDTAYDCTAIDEPYILFLEEVEEDYEHIHRYLTTLQHRGILDRAAGLIFGEWVDYPAECETYGGSSRGGKFQSVADMISREFLSGRDIPVAFGFPAGHSDTHYPLLMGMPVKLDVSGDGYTLEWAAPSEPAG